MTDLWTIGHSTRSLDDLVGLLHENHIDRLVDIRSLPGSKRHPQFNREALTESLPAAGIDYEHLPDLGGRRSTRYIKGLDDPASVAGWTHRSFSSYAAYAQTQGFRRGLADLIERAEHERVAYMCSEAVPWRCHRNIVSNALTLHGHDVHHILSPRHVEDHVAGRYGARPVLAESGAVIYP